LPDAFYAAVCADTWRLDARSGLDGAALGQELVRCATLAPSSHNTQCWKFALEGNGRSIAILPDLARRCPAVDPDDHHLFVSLGCAAENLIQAALARGLTGDVRFDPASDAVRVALEPTRAQSSSLFMVFVGQSADKAHWVDVGRCYERFALQATALGIRNAFLNQPVEVRSLRPQFAAAIGLADQRPDLVVRFGRGPTMPSSLRRPVQAVMF
jgi:hypothetical protein